MEKVSRRKLLGTLAVGATAALAGEAKADTIDQQKAKLQDVLEHVEIADGKMTRLAAGWIDPPDPDRPEFNAILSNIESECQDLMDTAERLMKRGT